ncbi:MAG: TonB-dependent receptor [Deltaproteobacteria bacterium]|jgi:hemoglobin/transferrin/lactoferrin receptor protein|nr:TonB-dependent receptor [Deltaproteobacteria bacterium]
MKAAFHTFAKSAIRSAAALLLGLTGASASAAWAQEGALDLPPVMVTARGYETSLADIPGGTAVAGERDVALAGRKGSLVDALDRLPGISRTGDSPWGQDISIRGLSGPSVVILIDGRRIITATDLNARLGYLSPDDVERIEVLKGPVSALYGSGSFGGVVNVITRKPREFADEPTFAGRLSASGSTNPEGGSAYGYLSYSSPKFVISASGGYRSYDDFFGAHHDRVINSGFRDSFGRAYLAFKPTEEVTLRTEFAKAVGHDIGLPGGVSSMPALAWVTYPTSEFTMLSQSLAYEPAGALLKKLELEFYYTANRRRVRVDNIPPVPTPPIPVELRPQADHDTFGGKLQAVLTPGDHVLTTGVDFWTWSMDSSRFRIVRTPAWVMFRSIDKPTPKAEQLSAGFFVDDAWKITPDWTLNLGGRVDRLRTEAKEDLWLVNPITGVRMRKLQNAGSQVDWGWQLHAGATWRFAEDWSQSLLLATAYRAADLLERYKFISLGGGVELFGNPNLKPERSIYVEHGLRYDGQPFSFQTRLFANFIDDYIVERRVTAARREMANVQTARIFGAELELNLNPLDGLDLYGSLAYLHGQDQANRQPLPGVAPLTALVGVEYHHSTGLWGRLESKFFAKQNRAPVGVERMPGATTVSAALGWKGSSGRLEHDVSLAVHNIFDERYVNALSHQRGFTVWEPGLSATLTYTLNF